MMRAGILLFLLGLILDLGAEDKVKPFPANRVRDFYREEARHWLEHQGEMPKILPQFPGLDGGVWGHWGQNPESDNADKGLNEVE